MKQITNKTIIKQEIGQEKCKEYGCGNSECIFECLNPKKIFKTYQPVEVDGVVYWINDELTIQDVKPYYGKYHYEKGVAINIFPDYLTDLSECKLIIAQSQPRIEGIPVVSLDSYVNELTKLDLIHLIKIVQKSEDYKSVMGINLENTLKRLLSNYKSNPNQYTQKDIEKAIELAQMTKAYGDYKPLTKEVAAEFKQETLEEYETIGDFIKRESKSGNESVGIVKGAKWQAERMYSGEQVRKILLDKILPQINSISLIEVDEFFQILNYK
jgi:hypothetical protein